MRILFVYICTLLLMACTNQNVYDGVKGNVRSGECDSLPSPSAYDECMDRRSESYGDYEKSRKEVLDKK